MATTPPVPSNDPFSEADAGGRRPDDVARVTNRILAKHAALKAERGGTAGIERTPTGMTTATGAASAPRPDVVIGIIVGNGWVEPEKLEALRDFFFKKGVTQVLRKRSGIATLLVERGILPPHLAKELELTLLDQGIFPRYRITRLLEQGLVGRTYAALDISAGVDVAFKVFRQPDAEKRECFLNDVPALAALRNRRVAQVLACGAHGEECFLASTLIVGERLSRLIATRKIESEVQAVRIALQVAEGLAYVSVYTSRCHAVVRPENVIVREQDGDALSVVLVDFGVCEQIPDYSAVDCSWRAPECAGGATGDLRSDIYAVGAILYFMLGAIATAPRAAAGKAIDLERFHALTREVVFTATAPEPGGRYRDYRSFIAALSRTARELGYIEPDQIPGAGSGPGGLGTTMLHASLAR